MVACLPISCSCDQHQSGVAGAEGAQWGAAVHRRSLRTPHQPLSDLGRGSWPIATQQPLALDDPSQRPRCRRGYGWPETLSTCTGSVDPLLNAVTSLGSRSLYYSTMVE